MLRLTGTFRKKLEGPVLDTFIRDTLPDSNPSKAMLLEALATSPTTPTSKAPEVRVRLDETYIRSPFLKYGSSTSSLTKRVKLRFCPVTSSSPPALLTRCLTLLLTNDWADPPPIYSEAQANVLS